MDEAQQVLNQNPITPASPIATSSTPQPAPTSKTSWVLISLIVSLLGVASYFGYQNYQLKQQITVQQPIPSSSAIVGSSPIPTTDTATNWDTYTSSKYNFSFEYPSTWQLNTTSNSFKQGDAISVFTTLQYDGKVSTKSLLFTIAKPVSTTLGLRDWIDVEGILTPYPGEKAPSLSKDATMGKESAIRIITCTEGCFTYLYATHNSQIYALSYPSDDTLNKSVQDSLSRIISTFQFTN